MVLLASDYLRGRFFRAEDFTEGVEKKFRIKSVTEEVMPDKKKKLVVWFTNADEGLVLNITNTRTLQGAFGDDTDHWAGKIVVLFSMMVDNRGKIVPGMRVRVPPPKGNGQVVAKPKAPPPDSELEDEPAKPKTLAEDLDDEIPWK